MATLVSQDPNTGPHQAHPIAVEGPGKEIQDSPGFPSNEVAIQTVEVRIDETAQKDEGQCEGQVSQDKEGAPEEGSFEAVGRDRAEQLFDGEFGQFEGGDGILVVGEGVGRGGPGGGGWGFGEMDDFASPGS